MINEERSDESETSFVFLEILTEESSGYTPSRFVFIVIRSI